MSTDKQRIGFIGLGYMGSRMAGRLLDARYPLTVYSRDPGKAQPLTGRGATVAGSSRELAAGCDVIMTSVPDDPAVEAVMFAPEGVLAGAKEGATIIDLSSVSPKTSRKVFAAAREKGVQMIDAPVSGSTPQAEEGALVILVGGEEEAFQACKPVLEHLGKSVVYMGKSGMGATMKLVINALLGAHLQTLAEALVLGEKAGLDKNRLLDVLSSSAHISPGQKAKMENVRKEKYPAQFPLRLMHKDFGLVADLAQELSVPMPATAAARQICAIEQAKGREEDCSAVLRLMEELAGIGHSRN